MFPQGKCNQSESVGDWAYLCSWMPFGMLMMCCPSSTTIVVAVATVCHRRISHTGQSGGTATNSSFSLFRVAFQRKDVPLDSKLVKGKTMDVGFLLYSAAIWDHTPRRRRRLMQACRRLKSIGRKVGDCARCETQACVTGKITPVN
jgi:hypothetical protein